MNHPRLSLLVSCFILAMGASVVRGQPEIGFLEKFALAADRRTVLNELIPGTEEHFYFRCLHYQNQNLLGDSQAILDAWRAKLGQNERVRDMVSRQFILSYAQSPQRTLDYLRNELGLNLDHAPPSRDRAATLPTSLDNGQLQLDRLLDAAIAADRSLGQIEASGLTLLLNRQLAPDQLRALLGRLERADLAGLTQKIAAELALQDTQGFGWAPVHGLLTLEQLDELLKLRPQLLETDAFVKAYSQRLAPAEGTSLADKQELRSYLERLRAWTQRLPVSQNSFKGLVLGNILRLDMSERKFDRAVFLAYLDLPRAASYYEPKALARRPAELVNLDFSMNPQVPLPAMGDDSDLVRRYLEHFLQSADSVDDFAPFLNREYLDRVWAQTKILYGIGEESTWYSKLSPGDQKELRERVELRFPPHNRVDFLPSESVSLDVELKHVEQLLIKIYEINLVSYYRNHQEPLSTSIDLDGLVPNSQRQLDFSQPAQRRHVETIDLGQLAGRGAWVVDFLGAGQRSRALIQKGRLLAIERLGDAGHVFEIVDEKGQPVPSAHLELNAVKYAADDQGRIVLPYAEQVVTRDLIIVDGDFASQETMAHQSERYELTAGFAIDRQALVAGTQAKLAIRKQLSCNDRPISIRLLDNPRLMIQSKDFDGITSIQSIALSELEDGDELEHTFLVPQRLASLRFTLSGRVYNQSRDEHVEVSADHTVECNAIQQSNQIADFYLQKSETGYQVLVLGRNGEPIGRLPVTVSVKIHQLRNTQNFTLATNQAGEVDLGPLTHATHITLDASGVQTVHFVTADFHRNWPAAIQVGQGEAIELPLGKSTAAAEQFSMMDMRRGVPQASLGAQLRIQQGALHIAGLTTGDYQLVDHEAGQRVRISVGETRMAGGYVASKHRLLQASRPASMVIREAKIEDGQLRVRVSGADELTRVHIVANAFHPGVAAAEQLLLPLPPLASRSIPLMQSHYVNSLKLDEEYSYILGRLAAQKFPGNMLTQPSVLVHPWEVSVTENERKDAMAGDAMPSSSPAAMAPSMMDRSLREQQAALGHNWKCFDFLLQGNIVVANLGLVDGQVSLPLENLEGFRNFSVIVVHPTGIDSRQLVQLDSALKLRDQRLRAAFAADVHLTQVQKVELLNAGEKRQLGDPKTRRLQTYSTVADVFQLYSTLLGNPEWEKFRRVGRWHEMSTEEHAEFYNEMACHELNFFLYHKDRKFFDRVVKPLVAQKLDKQLIDHWLLGNSLDEYVDLWRVQRLNTLERLLLANRLPTQKAGTERWLSEYVQANPLDPQVRQQRFEIALGGSALESESLARFGSVQLGLDVMQESAGALGGGGYGGGSGIDAKTQSARGLRRKATANNQPMDKEKDAANGLYFWQADRLGRDLNGRGLFQSLDKTREWAETQYYHVRLGQQVPGLVPANPFWQEFLSADGQPFLPHTLDLPGSSLAEALCALAVIDLPFKTPKHTLTIEEDQLVVQSESPAVVFLESIEAQPLSQAQESILVGQDLYDDNPGTDQDSNLPLGDSPLLQGTPYRASVVVTNPTGSRQRVNVLTQLPAGSLPLSGSRVTRSTSLVLEPYSTQQVSYVFYFPTPGNYDHYGAQVGSVAEHLASTASKLRRVTAEPESVDQSTWSYVADWGTNTQVLAFLSTANLQRIDASRIAFRLKDQAFYTQVTQLLSQSGRFDASLWAYAVLHDNPDDINTLLQNRPDFLARLGAAFNSRLVQFDPQQQMSYEHLDYKPLVIARMHRLGPTAVILNASLHTQYAALLDVLAHQSGLDNNQRLQVCYYLLLQNRLEEALAWFVKVERAELATHLQYDYFDAYLDFYRERYDRAAEIAQRYSEYPVPRWAELFAQIRLQVNQRAALIAGEATEPTPEVATSEGAGQRILTDRREQQQAVQAGQAPALSIEGNQAQLAVRFRNLETVQVNFYLMDIELLFSRNPFTAHSGEIVPPIRPNLSQIVKLSGREGMQSLDLPESLKNRNLMVEVTAAGISRSRLITANALAVSLTEAYGRLQVLDRHGRLPQSKAYIKVFAKHRDGSIRFYKDGYTDLRGQFDYATLSTGDLDTVERLAILVLDENLGAYVEEVKPPTR